jgi:hypothetical protein
MFPINCPESSRRHFLSASGFGLSGLALAGLLERDGVLQAAPPTKPPTEPVVHNLLPKSSHKPPKAQAMISLFLGGGPSHLDMLDPKPALKKYEGKIYPGSEIAFDNAGGATKQVMASPFKFEKRGQSGLEISEVLPHMASVADDLCLIRSMHLGGLRNHVAGMRALNTARGTGATRPALGSWLSYALGSESQNLPAFVAMPLYANPPGSPYWSSGFLPSIYQGTVVRDRDPRILNLDPPSALKGRPQREGLDLLKSLNEMHLQMHPGETDMAARIANYELAARMQLAASEAMDLSREAEKTREMYGLNQPETRRFGEACLVARRLVERGVRFVQIWHYNWDMHENINVTLPKTCRTVDKPSAALITDLKQRGMLDSTLVHWGGEMGRLPVIQYRGPGRTPGRDHNTDGFTLCMAGGGTKGGYSYGNTDEFGHKAVDKPVLHTDWLATVADLFGLDVNQMVYERGGQKLSLLDGQAGHVVKDVIA